MAFQLLTGNTDTQSRNMYLYSPTNSNTFYVLDWDNDGMLMRKENQIRNISTGSSWEQGVSNYWGNVLFKRCLQTKSFRDELDKAVKREYRYMSAKRINTMVDHYESITKQYLYQLAYQPFVEAHQIGTVRNCFLMPTSSAEIVEKGTVSLDMLSKLGLQDIQIRLLPAQTMYRHYIENTKMDIRTLNL